MITANIKAGKGAFAVDAEFEVPEKAVTALIGPSGAGKTTILRTIAGLERHPDSSVIAFGENWQSAENIVPAHKRPIGFVFQEPSLFPHLSVRGNIAYGAARAFVKDSDAKVLRAADSLGLENLLDREPSGLSGGESQRVAIARAIVLDPVVLLMDEPVSSLDADSRNEVLAHIERINRELGITILYVSHSADEVARLADHVVVLDRGKVRGSGPISEVLTRLDLPLASGPDAEAVVETEVAGHDDEFDLTLLGFPGGTFTVPRISAEKGEFVRLRVLARDISLTLEEQHGTSILNIFPAVVKDIAPAGESQMTVRLDCGGIPLLARLTRKSVSGLGVEKGKRVFAQAKSVAVLR